MASSLGKQRFKRLYLDLLTDLLFNTLNDRTASPLSKHAAGQCAEDLSQLVGDGIFLGRLEDWQHDIYFVERKNYTIKDCYEKSRLLVHRFIDNPFLHCHIHCRGRISG